jgi:type II secretory pathway component PulJ
VLTVVLAILILAILTAAALAALHWFQRRSSVTLPSDQTSVALNQTESPYV